MTANMSLRETFSNKNRRNLNATPAKLPLQTSKWQLKSFSSSQFHTLPIKSNFKSQKMEKSTISRSNLEKIETGENRRKIDVDNDVVDDSRYSPKNGFNSKSLKRIKSMKKSQSDILSILSSGENAIRELDSEFEDSIQKALKNVAEHKNAAENELQNELRISSKKSFKCKTCKRRFHHEYALENHQFLHQKTHQKSLDRSTIVRNDRQERSSVCYGTIRRAKSEIGQRRYECNHCPKSFSSKWKLKFHNATHMGEKTVLAVL